MTWIIEKTPKRWDKWVVENSIFLIGLLAAHQLIAMTVFALIELSLFWGGPMFDFWTFQFFLEDYLIFWGRWDMATTVGSATHAAIGNAVAWVIVVIALWWRIKLTGYEENIVSNQE